MTCYTDWIGTPRDGLPMFSEIAKTGANSVRIVWRMDLAKDSAISQLDAAITNAVANGLIPIVGIWDKTCKWSPEDVNEVAAWWTSYDVVKLMLKHEKHVIINFANEMGDYETSYIQYATEYRRAIQMIRNTGITSPIMIDAGNCGQDEKMLAVVGPELIKNDPEHNVLFGLHIWWTDKSKKRISNAITSLNKLKIPFVISEFAERSVDCKTPILYKEIIEQSQKNKIGYMPWSWDHQNACKYHAMTTDAGQSYSTLWGWGKEVMDKVKNTSVKSECL